MQHLHRKYQGVRVYCMVFCTFYVVAKMCLKSKESRYCRSPSINIISFLCRLSSGRYNLQVSLLRKITVHFQQAA